jgi:hypothetical protein
VQERERTAVQLDLVSHGKPPEEGTRRHYPARRRPARI